MPEVTRSITINAPIEKVFDIITDFETYPDFLKMMKDVTVEKKTKTAIEATFTIDILMKITYSLKFKLKRPTQISWEMIEGQMMKQNKGGWTLESLSPKKTEVTYSIDVNFGLLVPKQVTNLLVGNSLPEMLEAFKKRAEK